MSGRRRLATVAIIREAAGAELSNSQAPQHGGSHR